MTAQLVEPTDDQVSVAVETLKMLGDPTRLRIVWALLHGEHSVNELAQHVGAQPAAVSQHLSKLRLAHLVRTRREGVKVISSPRTHTYADSRRRPCSTLTTPCRPVRPTIARPGRDAPHERPPLPSRPRGPEPRRSWPWP